MKNMEFREQLRKILEKRMVCYLFNPKSLKAENEPIVNKKEVDKLMREIMTLIKAEFESKIS